ncbi:MAG: hypothetical protein ACK5Z5_07345 [Neisseriaceae bacterium]
MSKLKYNSGQIKRVEDFKEWINNNLDPKSTILSLDIITKLEAEKLLIEINKEFFNN